MDQWFNEAMIKFLEGLHNLLGSSPAQQGDTRVAYFGNLSGALGAAAGFDNGNAGLAERTFGRIIVLNR